MFSFTIHKICMPNNTINMSQNLSGPFLKSLVRDIISGLEYNRQGSFKEPHAWNFPLRYSAVLLLTTKNHAAHIIFHKTYIFSNNYFVTFSWSESSSLMPNQLV